MWKENDYLITAILISPRQRQSLSMSKLVYSLVLRKPLFKKESLPLSWCYFPFVPITAHFIGKRTFLISAVQVIKIISRSFSLFVFRKTSNIKTDYKAVYKISTCKFLSWKYSKTSTHLVSNLKILPFKIFLLLIFIKQH